MFQHNVTPRFDHTVYLCVSCDPYSEPPQRSSLCKEDAVSFLSDVNRILEAFAKKIARSDCYLLRVCPSFRMSLPSRNNSDPTERIFMEFDIGGGGGFF